MDSTYAETVLDLSERHLTWYVAQPVSENVSNSQDGEGPHLYDENANYIYLYGGKDRCAGTLYAQCIGSVPESKYPYRGSRAIWLMRRCLQTRIAAVFTLHRRRRRAVDTLTDCADSVHGTEPIQRGFRSRN